MRSLKGGKACSNTRWLAALVFLALNAESGAAHAALRNYTWGLFSLNGFVGLKFEDRENITADTRTNTQKLTEEISLLNKGFVWDPRFLTLNLGFAFQHSTTTYDEGEAEQDNLRYTLAAELFPKWRYPYRPLEFRAYRTINTHKDFGSPEYERVTNGIGLKWGLFQRHLGRVRMSYGYSVKEAVKGRGDSEQIKHDFDIDAQKSFREGQWGKTKLDYGYRFDATESDAGQTKIMQNSLFAREATDLGNNINLNAFANFIARTAESDKVDNSSNLFATGAGLRFRPNRDFAHNYRLSMSRHDNDGDVNTNYSGAAQVSYNHVFSDNWSGSASSSLNASFYQSDTGDSAFNSGATVAGGVSYRENFGTYQLTGGYRANLRQSFGDSSNATYFTHSAYMGYSRRRPLFTDRAGIRVHNTLSDDTSYQAIADYNIRSKHKLTEKQEVAGSATLAVTTTDASQTSAASGQGSWNLRISRSRVLQAAASYSLVTASNSSGANTRNKVYMSYMDQHFLSRFFRLRGNIYREQHTSDDDETTEIGGDLSLNMSLGKFLGTASYKYRDITRNNRVNTDHRLMFAIRRVFRIRY